MVGPNSKAGMGESFLAKVCILDRSPLPGSDGSLGMGRGQ